MLAYLAQQIYVSNVARNALFCKLLGQLKPNTPFGILEQEGAETDTPAQKALKLLLSAWARLEDEAAGTGRKQILEDARSDWGRLARDFLQTANE